MSAFRAPSRIPAAQPLRSDTAPQARATPTAAAGTAMLAVAMHAVQPRSYTQCRELRAWLAVRGVDAVTLLVVPAPDLHPFATCSPALANWLRGRTAAGDAVAQHGLAHTAPHQRRGAPRFGGRPRAGAAEFLGLDPGATEARVRTGVRLLHEMELDATGFVAPGYAYTPALLSVVTRWFDWFADGCSVTARGDGSPLRARAHAGGSWAGRAAAGRRLAGCLGRQVPALIRVDVHPVDIESPRRLARLAEVLARTRGHLPVTYDALAARNG